VARRRATGGTIDAKPSRGLWRARYVGADGRRHALYAKTRREVQERLREALAASDRGIRPVSHQLTLGAFLEDWLEHHVRLSRRPRTHESYAGIVRLYLIPELGRLPLAKLQPEHVQAMLARLRGRRGELSASTTRYVYTVLRIALGRAVKMGRAHRNVCTLIDPPARPRREIRPLSRAELGVLLEGIRGDRLEALYVTALGTGLRQGELLALRWQDVDLTRGELSVRFTLQRGTQQLAEPKTERARRTIRLPGAVRAALAEHRERQAVVPLSGLVFASRNGTALHSRNVTHYLQRHLQRLGLPHQRFHDLRHAFATVLIEDGEELGVVSRILGHADYATTADVYAHLTPAMLDRAAARMDGLLGARSL
jgi:integrase